MSNVFAVPIFFICLRETLETSIIVSVLLSFLKQTLGREQDAVTHKRLVRQVWAGTLLGFAICLVVGSGIIGAFYSLGRNSWADRASLWEGSFGIICTVIITFMGAALLRVSKLQDKWRAKLSASLEARDGTNRGTAMTRFKRWCERYAMFMLPFVTVLREGIEAVIFIGGVSLGLPATSFPLAVFAGLAVGSLVGYGMYRGGNMAPIQTFLIISTCFLYLVAAGLFSKAVWKFEENIFIRAIGTDASESGSGPGSYDIRRSVWHVNCCNPEINGGGGWGVFNALLGWQNSATYGSVISYNVYWIVVIAGFLALRYHENNGHWPLMQAKEKKPADGEANSVESPVIEHASKEGTTQVRSLAI